MATWKKIETSILEDPPAYLEGGDECYCARDYVSHGRYDASEANNLISNFKKDVSRKASNQWRHKLRAVAQFAQELAEALPENACVATIPTSTRDGDSGHDPRFELLLEQLQHKRADIIVEKPIMRSTTCPKLHHGAPRRIPEVYKTLQWNGFAAVPGLVFLIDDLITCGTHYKACKRLILEHHPGDEGCRCVLGAHCLADERCDWKDW